MHIQQRHSLKNLNTFGINAHAKYFVRLNNAGDLDELLTSEILKNEKHVILGGGSNVLFSKDFDGLVIKNNLKGISLTKEDEHYYYVKVGGGEEWHQFVLYSLSQNWYGLENLSLIPGCVGAAPIQNIGAYGVELQEVFHSLVFHHFDGQKECFDRNSCEFGYRNSIFKQRLKGKGIITEVTLQLSKRPAVNVSYGVLKNHFRELDVDEISPKMVSDAVIDIRKSKLPDPEVLGNAGSFFKNPMIDQRQLNALLKSYPEIPYYTLENEQYKIPAAWLIDQCGWKGKRKGNAGVHTNQALVLVNYGDASGEEIVDLACEISNSVKDKFNIFLETEVNVI